MDDPGDDLEDELSDESSSEEDVGNGSGNALVADDYEYLTIASTAEWTTKRDAMASQMMATIPERRNIMWTPDMDSVLIRFLYDEAVSGNKSRLKTMKKEHSATKTRLDLSGITFNPETKLIEGDEIAWTDYLRNPSNYDEMVMIFGKDMANGSNHLEAFDDTETNTEFLHRNLIDEIDDTRDEGMPFPPVIEPFTLGMGDGSNGSKLRHHQGPGNNDPTKHSRSRFSNEEDPEIKQSFVTLAQAAKDIA
ncbi:hypothetical protein FRX31_015650 [Thalictrum thalictroides]|uniref:Uncharacterized protein n=1 Tax=Thalictrum thalictroides TaxID=46969 RepID=A0A7J6WCQ0_THATH|nr:hypothetical protein FRX31_015650 [Thalictrum thalictroides]